MTDLYQVAPPDEQEICVRCGFCCDGTLFHHANLNHGERGSLPERIEEACFSRDDNDYFRLPCLYFDRKCTIYNQKRAAVCSDFRCQLLRDQAAGKLSPGEAIAVVEHAVRIRGEILREFTQFTGKEGAIPFLRLLQEFGKIRSSLPGGMPAENGFEMLQARCNIFEALLIRHFWSAGEFDKLIMK